MPTYYLFTGDNQAFFTPKPSDFQEAPASVTPASSSETLWVKAPDGTYETATPGAAAGWHLDPSKGLAFQVGANGQPSYGSPHGSEPSGAGNYFRSQVWNPETGQYEGSTNWGTIATIGVGAGLGLGALSAAGAFGAGGAATGGGATAAETATPELVGTAAGPGSTALAVGTQPSSLIAGAAGEGSAATAIPAGAAALPASAAPVIGAGAGAGTAAAGTTAATTGGLWHALASPVAGALIGAGANVIGAAINAHAQNNATDAQSAAAREALDFQKQKLAEEDSRLAPYRAVGGNAISRLGSLWGLSSTSAPGVGAQGPYNANTGLPARVPYAQGDYPLGPFVPASQGPQGGSMAALGAQGPAAPASSGFVSMIAPDGTRNDQVPAALKDYYLGKGAQLAPQGATV